MTDIKHRELGEQLKNPQELKNLSETVRFLVLLVLLPGLTQALGYHLPKEEPANEVPPPMGQLIFIIPLTPVFMSASDSIQPHALDNKHFICSQHFNSE